MFNFPLAPERASSIAGFHDIVFYTLVGLTVLFTLLVGFLVIFFAIRFRAGHKVNRSRPVHENLPLEIAWSVLPLLLGLVVFFMGAKLFVDERTPPKDAMEIYVIGKQWMWHIQHQNGVRENNTLHVPIGKPVKLTMISQDVIHAFYIPEFRVQYHVVPGRYTQIWFTATKPGTYHMFCGMFCGTQHSEMGGTVVAMPADEFAKWEQNGGNDVPPMTMQAYGAQKFHQYACDNCHVSKDTDRAPSLYGLMGKARKFQNGSGAIADPNYIRLAILQPEAKMLTGYINTMPTYQGQISEEDLLSIVAYIKTLSNAPETASNQPQTGVTPTQTATVTSVGALATQTPPKSAPPKPGNLAVGALSSQFKGNK